MRGIRAALPLLPLLALLPAGFLPPSAGAGLPDPDLSNVPKVLYVPNGSMEYVIYVGAPDGPVAGATVDIQFSDEAAGLLCWCTGQQQPIIQGTTNAAGMVSFFIAAGGCLDPAYLSRPPVTVYANGFWLAEVGCVSPDAADGSALLPWEGWDPQGQCTAGFSDAILHTPPFALGTTDYCSDLDSDGVVGLSDAIMATPALSFGYTCQRQ